MICFAAIAENSGKDHSPRGGCPRSLHISMLSLHSISCFAFGGTPCCPMEAISISPPRSFFSSIIPLIYTACSTLYPLPRIYYIPVCLNRGCVVVDGRRSHQNRRRVYVVTTFPDHFCCIPEHASGHRRRSRQRVEASV